MELCAVLVLLVPRRPMMNGWYIAGDRQAK